MCAMQIRKGSDPSRFLSLHLRDFSGTFGVPCFKLNHLIIEQIRIRHVPLPYLYKMIFLLKKECIRMAIKGRNQNMHC
jgi:hypothetical protein